MALSKYRLKSIQQEKKTRDDLLKERLRKVKQKRMLKEGYSLEDIESINKIIKVGNIPYLNLFLKDVWKAEAEAEMEFVANEAKQLQEEEEQEREELAKIEERKKSLPVLDREWDKPKLSTLNFIF